MLNNMPTTGEQPQPKPIDTATIYATVTEWEHFKAVAAREGRLEAAHLMYLAQKALDNPNFKMIPRPRGEKPSRQIRTKKAAPYLIQLVERVKRETGQTVTQSDVAESLVRALYQQ